MSVTKIVLPPADYHQVTQADLSDGDILDVFTSLKLRPARQVLVEAITGDTTIRLNVVTQIYKNFDHSFNSWVGLGQGATTSSGKLVGEIIEPKDNIVIPAGTSYSWSIREFAIKDIQCITLGSSVKITIS